MSKTVVQGVLYVMMLPAVTSTIVNDWKFLRDTLPLIVKVQLIFSVLSIDSLLQADHSEKPSILNLMNRLVQCLVHRYEYLALTSQVVIVSVSAVIMIPLLNVCALLIKLGI